MAAKIIIALGSREGGSNESTFCGFGKCQPYTVPALCALPIWSLRGQMGSGPLPVSEVTAYPSWVSFSRILLPLGA